MKRAVAAASALALGCAPSRTWRALSPDHRTAVEIGARGGRACVAVGARRDGCFDAVAVRALAFSALGGHVAYPVQVGSGGGTGRGWAVVRDGMPGPVWEGVGAPVWSPDGARLAYAALRGASWRLVVNDTAGEAFDSLLEGSVSFGGLGRRLGYVGRRGDSVHAVIDGVRGPGWEGIGALGFSPDGGRYAYVARSGARAALVMNGRAEPWHDGIAGFAFAPAGEGFAYLARDGATWSVIAPPGARGPYRAVRDLGYRPADGGLSYVVRDSGGESVVMAEAAAPRHDSVEAPTFSRSGARWGYIAHDSARASVVVDGAPLAREEWAGDLVFSDDGTRFAYLARRGDGMAVVDDRGRHEFDLVVAGTLQFLRGRTIWVCLAGDRARRRLYVVVEDVPARRPFDWSEAVRLIQGSPRGAALRAWVAAEGELALEGGRP